MGKLEIHPRAKTSGFWLMILALILAAYAVSYIADTGRTVHDPRHPVPASPSAQPSPEPAYGSGRPTDHTPVCDGPMEGQCWESERDGGPATVWRENPRAMMLSVTEADELSRRYPGRDWPLCWHYIGQWDTIECPDGYRLEVSP